MDTLQYYWPEQANLTADHDFSKCPSGVPDKDFSNWLPDAAQFGQDKDGRPNQATIRRPWPQLVACAWLCI